MSKKITLTDCSFIQKCCDNAETVYPLTITDQVVLPNGTTLQQWIENIDLHPQSIEVVPYFFKGIKLATVDGHDIYAPTIHKGEYGEFITQGIPKINTNFFDLDTEGSLIPKLVYAPAYNVYGSNFIGIGALKGIDGTSLCGIEAPLPTLSFDIDDETFSSCWINLNLGDIRVSRIQITSEDIARMAGIGEEDNYYLSYDSASKMIELYNSYHSSAIYLDTVEYLPGEGINIDSNNEVSIKPANFSNLGGFKLGHSETKTEKPVLLDAENRAYVLVKLDELRNWEVTNIESIWCRDRSSENEGYIPYYNVLNRSLGYNYIVANKANFNKVDNLFDGNTIYNPVYNLSWDFTDSTGQYVALIYASDTCAKGDAYINIHDDVTNTDTLFYLGFILNPTNSVPDNPYTVGIFTDCPWEFAATYVIDTYVANVVYIYMKTPVGFTGTITLMPSKVIFKSGDNVGTDTAGQKIKWSNMTRSLGGLNPTVPSGSDVQTEIIDGKTFSLSSVKIDIDAFVEEFEEVDGVEVPVNYDEGDFVLDSGIVNGVLYHMTKKVDSLEKKLEELSQTVASLINS